MIKINKCNQLRFGTESEALREGGVTVEDYGGGCYLEDKRRLRILRTNECYGPIWPGARGGEGGEEVGGQEERKMRRQDTLKPKLELETK